MVKKIFCLWLFLNGTSVYAQKARGVSGQPIMPGPDGVYIFIIDKASAGYSPDLSKTYFISKDENGRGDFKRIATLKFPSTSAELATRLGPELLNEILQQRKLRSAEDLFRQISTGKVDTLGLYLMNPDVMIAMGILYPDKSKHTSNTGYRVESEKNGVTLQLYQKYLKEVVYTPFPKFRRYKVIATDSAISCTWYAVGGQASMADVFQSDETSTSSSRRFTYKTRDTLFVSYTAIAKPGVHYMVFLRPTDFAGNSGHPSDTIRVIASSMTDAIGIQNVNMTDTSKGMLLRWDPLPDKSWIAGIQISKSHDAMENYLVVDTLPANTTSWLDRNVIGGTIYYYRLMPVFYDLPNKPRAALTLAHGEKKFVSEKMLAPQGLAATLDSGKNIRLSWKPDAVLNMFGYYVLRGTSPDSLEVISSPLADTVFVDSLKNLNPGSTYFYAIAARDLNMKWSDTSETLTIMCPVNLVVTAPAGLSARYSEHGVRLIWNDVSLTDEKVIGYVIYKRRKGDAYFKSLMKHPWPDHVYTDTMIENAGDYEYGCASMNARGNQSVLSSLASVTIPGSAILYPPASFGLKNSAAGVVISIPPFPDAKKGRQFFIYKRAASEKNFKKAGTIPVDETVFIDKNVKNGTLYVYAVSMAWQGSESSMSREKAIRRN